LIGFSGRQGCGELFDLGAFGGMALHSDTTAHILQHSLPLFHPHRQIELVTLRHSGRLRDHLGFYAGVPAWWRSAGKQS
jgi:hypothetical protein